VVAGPGHTWLGTGGTVARVYHSSDRGVTWTVSTPPLLAGGSSTGIFSLAFADSLTGVAVGGDYEHPDSARGNIASTADGGRTWRTASTPPRGYRSGIAIRVTNGGVMAVAVGTSGSDVSFDGGRSWSPLDRTGFNAVQFAPGGVAFAVGGRGRTARLLLTSPARP
jgi:photosystem II stability/assembly factor-like uncharacterized protein